MKKIATINPKLRLAFAIAVPVLVMIVTITMVGMSFAWFSDSATVEISTISLTTKEVYSISISTQDGGAQTPYHGETAMAYTNQSASVTTKGLYHISQYRATQLGYNSSDTTAALYNTYMADYAFSFVTQFKLTSTNVAVDLTMTLDTVQIKNYLYDSDNNLIADSGYVMDTYGVAVGTQTETYTTHSVDEIPYVFTWYMTESVYDADNQKYVEDTSVLYTPYGKMTLVSEDGALYAQGFDSIKGKNPSDITSFTPNADSIYNFYIVFAPEELFWMQYVKADRDLTANDVYTTDELKYIVTTAQPYQMYYAGYNYLGASFDFTASIRVSNIHWTDSEGGNA